MPALELVAHNLPTRPRRSILYVPGINARALEKAVGLDVDGLIIDLEDSVAPDKKREALAVLVKALQNHDYGHREISVRVSGIGTETIEEELAALATLPVNIINFPKMETAEQVQQAVSLMETANCQQPLSLMIESPRAILDLEKVVGASRRVVGLVMGTSDMVKDIHGLHLPGRENLAYALSKAVFVARAYGIFVIDGVSLDLSDNALHASLCEQGRAMGFDGKSLIHPKQIAAAHQAFTPSDAQIAQAETLIAAHKAAVDAGKGVVVVDGKLVENLHVEQAHNLIAMTAMIKRQGRYSSGL